MLSECFIEGVSNEENETFGGNIIVYWFGESRLRR